jgi:hypothetical protein
MYFRWSLLNGYTHKCWNPIGYDLEARIELFLNDIVNDKSA